MMLKNWSNKWTKVATQGLCLAGLLMMVSACQHTTHSVQTNVDPWQHESLRAVKEGNLQLIVSAIDHQAPVPKVLVELERKSHGETMDTNPRKIFYNTLPEPDANMLVLSHYNVEPGSYRIKFWEEGTGTAAETSIHISEDKHYLVAFYEYVEDRKGNAYPKFSVRHSNSPIVTDLTPRQVGKVQ